MIHRWQLMKWYHCLHISLYTAAFLVSLASLFIWSISAFLSLKDLSIGNYYHLLSSLTPFFWLTFCIIAASYLSRLKLHRIFSKLIHSPCMMLIQVYPRFRHRQLQQHFPQNYNKIFEHDQHPLVHLLSPLPKLMYLVHRTHCIIDLYPCHQQLVLPVYGIANHKAPISIIWQLPMQQQL